MNVDQLLLDLLSSDDEDEVCFPNFKELALPGLLIGGTRERSSVLQESPSVLPPRSESQQRTAKSINPADPGPVESSSAEPTIPPGDVTLNLRLPGASPATLHHYSQQQQQQQQAVEATSLSTLPAEGTPVAPVATTLQELDDDNDAKLSMAEVFRRPSGQGYAQVRRSPEQLQ